MLRPFAVRTGLSVLVSLMATLASAQGITDSERARYQSTDLAFDAAKKKLDAAVAASGYPDPARYRPAAVRPACAEFLNAQRAWLAARSRLNQFDPPCCERTYFAGYEKAPQQPPPPPPPPSTPPTRSNPPARSNPPSAPGVTIRSPTRGEVYTPPAGQHATVTVKVEVTDVDGDLARVRLVRESDEGTHEAEQPARPGQSLYTFQVPLRAGVNTLRAEGVDSRGLRASTVCEVIEEEAAPIVAKIQVATRHASGASGIIPVPGETRITVKATDAQGKPLSGARVRIEVERIPFLTFDFVSAEDRRDHLLSRLLLDARGSHEGAVLRTRAPVLGTDAPHLTDVPLRATVTVSVLDPASGALLGASKQTFPFNLALLQGVTAGPDMKPRREPEPPHATLSLKPHDLATEQDDQGRFRVLVQPYRPDRLEKINASWALIWSPKCSLPLLLPIPAPELASTVDVGLVDVLSPAEHEQRLRTVLAAFIDGMSLTPEAKKTAKEDLASLSFKYGSTQGIPVYGDNKFTRSGTVLIPGAPEDYWGDQRTEKDPAYTIIPHELGHFLHHSLIESHGTLCWVGYTRHTIAQHHTWVAPFEGSLVARKEVAEVAQQHTSFSESNADFFALLLRQFWRNLQPDIEKSVYFKDASYLTELSTDDKALELVQKGARGDVIEGVQTRLLRAYYDDHFSKSPALVYADYLLAMARHVEVSGHWFARPARTMPQWVAAKASTPNYLGGDEIAKLASRYGIRAEAASAPIVTPAHDSPARTVIQAGPRRIEFGSQAVAEVPFGQALRVLEGTVVIDLSAPGKRRLLRLSSGGTIVVNDEGKVLLKEGEGRLIVEGQISVVATGATLEPIGTVFLVEWAHGKLMTAWSLDGHVNVTRPSSPAVELAAGERLRVGTGSADAREPFDVAAKRNELLGPSPATRFVPAGASRGPWAWIAGAALLGGIGFVLVRKGRRRH